MRAARIFGGTGRVHPPDGSVPVRSTSRELQEPKDETRIGDVHGNICTRKALRAHPPVYRTLAPQDTITGALIIEHIGLVLPQTPPPDHVVRFTPVVTNTLLPPSCCRRRPLITTSSRSSKARSRRTSATSRHTLRFYTSNKPLATQKACAETRRLSPFINRLYNLCIICCIKCWLLL